MSNMNPRLVDDSTPGHYIKKSDDGARIENGSLVDNKEEIDSTKTIKVPPGTIRIGEQLFIKDATGNLIFTRGFDNQTRIPTVVGFDETGTILRPFATEFDPKDIKEVIQPDDTGENLGTELTYPVSSVDNQFVFKAYARFGSTVPVAPLRFRMYINSISQDNLVVDIPDVASVCELGIYQANTEFCFDLSPIFGILIGEMFYAVFSSNDPFSLKADVSNTTPWFAVDRQKGDAYRLLDERDIVDHTDFLSKSEYDQDDSGVVDDAEKLGGQDPSHYAIDSEVTKKDDTSLTGNGYFKNDSNFSSPDPEKVASEQAVKIYVDKNIAGVPAKENAHVATTTYLDNVGLGTWTKSGAKTTKVMTAGTVGALVIDGHPMELGDRIYIKDENGSSVNLTNVDNGMYDVTIEGDAGTVTELRRSDDFDGVPPTEVKNGVYAYVTLGTENQNTGWRVLADGVVEVDVDPMIITQFQGLPGNHASTHIDGSDDIQEATAFQKGLATAVQIGKLDDIELEAQKNVKSDWNSVSGDSEILNKPSDLTDLTIHSATELNDITNAGSGAIITTPERLNLSNQSNSNSGDVTLDTAQTTQDALTLTSQKITANLVTETKDGVMSKEDKEKFNNISENGAGDGWISGLDTSENNPKDTSILYGAGIYLINGETKAINPAGVYDLSNGFGSIDHYLGMTNDQHAIVTIYADAAEVIKSIRGDVGEKGSTIFPPLQPSDSVCIAYAEIKVDKNDIPKDIDNKHIFDCRTSPSLNTDETVSISADDQSTGYLADKISNNGNVQVTIENVGGNETIKLDATGGGGALPSLEHTVDANIDGVDVSSIAPDGIFYSNMAGNRELRSLSGGVDNQRITLVNIAASTIKVKDTTGIGQMIKTDGSGDKTFGDFGGCILVYRASTGYWYLVSHAI